MNRIYGGRPALDYVKVEKFFRDRSAKIGETGPLSVTMYQTEEIAKRRDEHEKSTVAPRLGIRPSMRVLDIGCGTGRWGRFLSDRVTSYLGLDFCQAYVDAGLKFFAEAGRESARFSFQRLGATEVSEGTLRMPPPFDLIIVGGLLAFLNDDDVHSLASTMASLCSANAVVYVREPMARAERLTLKDFPSAELQQDYSAIYRTDHEVIELLRPLVATGAVLDANFPLYPQEMLSPATRDETLQRVLLFRFPG